MLISPRPALPYLPLINGDNLANPLFGPAGSITSVFVIVSMIEEYQGLGEVKTWDTDIGKG